MFNRLKRSRSRPQRIFKFKAPDASFECALKMDPCSAPGCIKSVTIGLPYCKKHLRTELGLSIKPSRIPHSGLGVFATSKRSGAATDVVFPKGAVICAYGGETLSLRDLILRYGVSELRTAPYTIAYDDEVFLDAACFRSVGSMVNHSMDANASFEKQGAGVVLVASRDITNGEEVLVDYGKDYVFHEEGVSFSTSERRRGRSRKRRQ